MKQNWAGQAVSVVRTPTPEEYDNAWWMRFYRRPYTHARTPIVWRDAMIRERIDQGIDEEAMKPDVPATESEQMQAWIKANEETTTVPSPLAFYADVTMIDE